MFHKILKSGCRAEEARLRTAERLVKSWRVFWMTMINRSTPDAEPEFVLTDVETDVEIVLLDHLISDKAPRPAQGQTLAAYLTKIARLGG